MIRFPSPDLTPVAAGEPVTLKLRRDGFARLRGQVLDRRGPVPFIRVFKEMPGFDYPLGGATGPMSRAVSKFSFIWSGWEYELLDPGGRIHQRQNRGKSWPETVDPSRSRRCGWQGSGHLGGIVVFEEQIAGNGLRGVGGIGSERSRIGHRRGGLDLPDRASHRW